MERDVHKPLMVHIVLSLPRFTFKSYSKYQTWGTLSEWERGYCAARRDIHCYWSISKPCYYVQWRCEKLLTAYAYVSPLWFTPCPVYQGQLSKLRIKYLISSIISARGKGCCTTRNDIHCCWSVSKPSLVEQGWWEELMIISTSLPWFTSCYFYRGLPSNCQSTRLGVPSQNGKGGTVLQGETYIAIGAFQNLAIMYSEDVRNFWQHIQDPHGSHRALSTKVNSQICT